MNSSIITRLIQKQSRKKLASLKDQWTETLYSISHQFTNTFPHVTSLSKQVRVTSQFYPTAKKGVMFVSIYTRLISVTLSKHITQRVWLQTSSPVSEDQKNVIIYPRSTLNHLYLFYKFDVFRTQLGLCSMLRAIRSNLSCFWRKNVKIKNKEIGVSHVCRYSYWSI